MKVGIVGTGTVGRTLAQGFTEKGHDVVIGTRDVDALMARTEGDAMGNPPFAQWKAEHPEIGLTTQADAMAHGEIVVNATDGEGSEAALSAGGEHLTGTIVLDASNPIDHASGWPPSLFVANTDSLGERLQAGLPAGAIREGVEHDDGGADDRPGRPRRRRPHDPACAATTPTPRPRSPRSWSPSDGGTSSTWATSPRLAPWRLIS